MSTAEARVGSGAIHDGVIYEEATEANARSWASLAAVRTHEGGIGSSAAAMSAGDSVDGVRWERVLRRGECGTCRREPPRRRARLRCAREISHGRYGADACTWRAVSTLSVVT